MRTSESVWLPVRLARAIFGFVNRHLTLVSVGVLALGVVLVVGGTVRAVLGSNQSGGSGGGSPWGSRLTLGGGGESPGGETGIELGLDQPILNREPAPYTIIPDRPRKWVTQYTVQAGDTVFAIADKFGLSPDTIFWANSTTLQDNVHLLRPGMELNILPISGVYHRASGKETIAQIAERYYVEPEDIINSEFNELAGYSPEDRLPEGMKVVVPGGQREYVDFAWVVPSASSGPGGAPAPGRFAPGHPGSCPPVAGRGGTGAWIRPVQGPYSITTGYYPYHTGIDMSSNTGTPIVAADSGVVIFAGWNDWGYGNLVVLDHGNGWTSFYAHLSSVGVGCGQFVSRGGYLGAMGSTGRSSGPHLHFEMRWNFVPDNPLNHVAL
jgi:murein DD-endopeptidase MepM/ murein hydrolase activator NlpD